MSYNSSADWMEQAWNWIYDRPLSRVCLPGSHDSAMAVLTHSTNCSTRDNTRTQKLSIADQLLAGCRFFDIRPTLWGDTWYSGHGSKTLFGWLGSVGETIADILSAVASFVADHPFELVVLRFSHVAREDGKTAPSIDAFAWTVLDMTSGMPVIRFDEANVILGAKTMSELRNAGRVLCIFDGLRQQQPDQGLFKCTWADPLVDLPPAVAALGDNNVVALCASTHGLHGDADSADGSVAPFADLPLCPAFQTLRFVRTVNAPGATLSLTWNPPTVLTGVVATPGVMPAIATSGNMVMAVYSSCDLRSFRAAMAGDARVGLIPPGDGQLGVICSTDGGVTWSHPQILDGTRTTCAPTVAGDGNGNFYVMFVATENSASPLCVMRLTPGSDGRVSPQPVFTLSESSTATPSLAWSRKGQCLVAVFRARGNPTLRQTCSYPNSYTQWYPSVVASYQQPLMSATLMNATPTSLASSSAPALAIDEWDNKMLCFTPTYSKGQAFASYQDSRIAGWTREYSLDDAPQTYLSSVVCVGGTFIAFYMLPDGVIGYSLCEGVPSQGGDPALWQSKVPRGSYHLYDDYTNSSDYKYVIRDQLSKYDKFSCADYSMFLLSWTCTQTPGRSSIENLAATINPHLDQAMSGLMDSRCISPDIKVPNVLSVDFFDEFVTQVAWKINTR